MISNLVIRRRHVVLLALFMSMVAALALGTAAAQTARTPVNAGVPLAHDLTVPIAAYDSFQGWGMVRRGNPNVMYVRMPHYAAWQWNAASGWKRTERPAGERVYLYPFARGWMWTWNESRGWLAMETSDLVIGYRSNMVAT